MIVAGSHFRAERACSQAMRHVNVVNSPHIKEQNVILALCLELHVTQIREECSEVGWGEVQRGGVQWSGIQWSGVQRSGVQWSGVHVVEKSTVQHSTVE